MLRRRAPHGPKRRGGQSHTHTHTRMTRPKSTPQMRPSASEPKMVDYSANYSEGGSVTTRPGSAKQKGLAPPHPASNLGAPPKSPRYAVETASSNAARRELVSHYGRMCNPRQGYSEASNPRGAPPKSPRVSTMATTPREGVRLRQYTSSTKPVPTHQWGDQVPSTAGTLTNACSASQQGVMSTASLLEQSMDLTVEPVVDGVPTAAASFVSGPAETATGKVAVLLICACDAHGVPVRGGAPFIASVHGPAACRTELRDLLDGRYELRVATPAISGDFRVAVTLHGRAIGGSPHALTVLAPIAHYQHIEARGPALELATAGELASFELIAHDAHGKRMTYGGEQYSVRLKRLTDLADTLVPTKTAKAPKKGQYRTRKGSKGKGADGEVVDISEADATPATEGNEKLLYGRVEDRRDGSYVATYSVATTGRYELQVYCLKSGKQIKGSPWMVLVAPGPTYAPSSFLRGHELGKAVAGRADELHGTEPGRGRGNPQLFGGEPWAATITGPYPHAEPLDVQLADRGDGTYKGELTMAVAGEYALDVTLRGSHARGSPLRISTASSGVHAPRCTAEGAGIRSAVKGKAASFKILARDAFGNRVPHSAHGYSARVRPPLSATRAPDVYLVDNGDGTCGCEWLPTTRGRHVISVTLGGVPIEGSDFISHVS